MIVLLFNMSLFPAVALAIGGSDEEPLTKINRATRQCQQTIAWEGRRYAAKRAKAIGQCLNAMIKCDERRTAEKAESCRRKTINPDSGPCALGVLDSGIFTLGAGAANTVVQGNPNARERLDRAMLNFVERVDDQCFHDDDVDLVSSDTGLGFTEDPQTASALVDLLNRNPGGVGCAGNELVRIDYPLANQIINETLPVNFTCVKVDSGIPLGTFCFSDSDCGTTKGKCGKMATAVSLGIASCIAEPSP